MKRGITFIDGVSSIGSRCRKIYKKGVVNIEGLYKKVYRFLDW